MFHWTRAAGLSAAIFAVAGVVIAAQPTQALDYAANPLAPRYIDHAEAKLDVEPLTVDVANDSGQVAPAVDFSTPVDQHAEAAIESDAPKADDDGAPPSLFRLVVAHASADTDDAQQQCVAQAVYFESKGEPLEGQLAVAEVILNRAASGRFPSTPCGVVKQKSQFSFVRGGHIPDAPRASAAWRKAVAIADIAMQDLADSRGSKALFFHATRVSPQWRGVSLVGTIGHHIFYR